MQYDAHANRRRNIRRWFNIQSMADAMQMQPATLVRYLQRLKEINDRRTSEQNRKRRTDKQHFPGMVTTREGLNDQK